MGLWLEEAFEKYRARVYPGQETVLNKGRRGPQIESLFEFLGAYREE